MKKDVPIKRKVNHRPDPREQARAASGVKRRKRRLRKYTIYYILLLLIVLTAMITLSMMIPVMRALVCIITRTAPIRESRESCTTVCIPL